MGFLETITGRNNTNPRKIERGTSYRAEGLAEPSIDTELGSSTPIPIREIVPELSNPFQRLSTYNRMLQDAGVDVSMRAAKTPILGAEFFIEPYSDDSSDLEIAEFVWSNLAEGMNSPFLNSLHDILRMYEDGYSVVEKVYELREWTPKRNRANTRQFTMLKKLAPRPASTIKKIEYDDNGGPQNIVQSAIRPDGSVDEVNLDISKAIVFTFGRVAGDLTGRSLLRTAYPHWYYKSHFYKIDAVQKERHSLGIPKGKLLPGFTNRDKLLLRQLLRNIRTNEEAFMVLTPNVDVEFAKVEGQLVDVLKSAAHHNMMILLNVMGQFLALGLDSDGGGRATAGTHSDLFMKSLRYVATHIADMINMYLIPELVVWNFPTKNFPKLQVRNIGETRDLQQLGSALSNIFAQGIVTPDLDTEQWVRRVFDMPSKRGERTPTNTSDTENEPSSNGKGTARRSGGYQGKPPGAAAFGETNGYRLGEVAAVPNLAISIPTAIRNPAPPDVEIENKYDFNHEDHHEHKVEVKIDEGAIKLGDNKVEVPAPVINLTLQTEAGETVIREVKPKAAVATKLEDGSTRIVYEYEDNNA